jgi:lipoyl(octanoyl) transferase
MNKSIQLILASLIVSDACRDHQMRLLLPIRPAANLRGMTRDELWVCHLGTVPYLDAVTLQEQIRARRQAEDLPDTLLLLEHPPVYTYGRRSAAGELPFDEDFYRAKGIDLVATDRGGRVTYHGPGQLVGYPIMGVTGIGSHLRTMETAIVAALDKEGIEARSRAEEGPDYTGVWVGPQKIASIGVHVSRHISTHGFAVNVNNDLDPFSWVVACGLPDVAMTSIAREQGAVNPERADYFAAPAANRAPGIPCFRKRMAHTFCEAHGRRQRLVSPGRLGIDAPLATAPSRRVAVPA